MDVSGWHTGLVARRHVGSSRTRNRTRVPRIARRTLNHWTTREALSAGFCFQSEGGDDQTVILKEAKKMWRKRDVNGTGGKTGLDTPLAATRWRSRDVLHGRSRGRRGLVSAGFHLGVMQGGGNQGCGQGGGLCNSRNTQECSDPPVSMQQSATFFAPGTRQLFHGLRVVG